MGTWEYSLMDDFHRLLLYSFLYLTFYLHLEIHTRSMPGLDRLESLGRNVRMQGTSTPGHAYAFATTVLEMEEIDAFMAGTVDKNNQWVLDSLSKLEGSWCFDW